MHYPTTPDRAAMSIAAALAAHRGAEALQDPALPTFSLARALQGLLGERGVNALDSHEGEVVEALAQAEARHHDPRRPVLPWSAMARRDLTVGTPGAGGYLVATEAPEPVHPLQAWSIAARAGVTVLPLQGNAALPILTGDPTAHWQGSDVEQVTPSTPSLGASAARPKSVMAFVKVSRRLVLQAGPAVEAMLRTAFRRALVQAIDTAIVTGSGADGQPQGLASTAGVGTTTGSGLDWADVLQLQTSIATATGGEDGLSWLAHPTTKQILAARARGTDLGAAIWSDHGGIETMANRPSFVTTAVPANALVCGHWPSLLLPVWSGIQVDTDPFSAFQSGTIAFRCAATLDVVCVRPAHFSVVTGVS